MIILPILPQGLISLMTAFRIRLSFRIKYLPPLNAPAVRILQWLMQWPKWDCLQKDAFTSNDELIAFTELVQKSFKLGGASSSEQSSALLQLTQAMAAGRLQGDEFRSIMENAPMIADAIAKYMGKPKGELKELAAEGAITADIIKNAVFDSAKNINDMFDDMPRTFGDAWNEIKNGALQAFTPVMQNINALINSPGFTQLIDSLIAGFNIVAFAVNIVIDTIREIGEMISYFWPSYRANPCRDNRGINAMGRYTDTYASLQNYGLWYNPYWRRQLRVMAQTCLFC